MDTFAPGLQKVGKPASGSPSGGEAPGPLMFILESDDIGDASASPSEPFWNVFTLKLMDANGQPVKDAIVTLPANSTALGWPLPKNPWMPLHTHGSSIATPPVRNNGDGTYTIAPYLSMVGLWQIYVVAQTGGIAESAEYSFCLE